MRKSRSERFLLPIGLLFIVPFVLTGCFNFTLSERTVPVETAQNALDVALSLLDKPYHWGGNGPDAFDCSGLIMWSYQQVTAKTLYYQTSEGLAKDIRIDDLYSYNTTSVNAADVRPGDIVFVTSRDGSVTHGGLFIEWINPYSFLYVNASSEQEGVVTDVWTLGLLIHGNWFVGFGRLIERTVL